MDGLWRGTITAVATNGNVWVNVPRLSTSDFGPVENLVVALAKGDRVLVGSREGRADAVEIIRQLP